LGALWLFILIIDHGLFTSGLFCLANISYGRLGRSSLSINNQYLSDNKTITSKTKTTKPNKAQGDI
jgi:hypothetical protein